MQVRCTHGTELKEQNFFFLRPHFLVFFVCNLKKKKEYHHEIKQRSLERESNHPTL